MGLRETGAAGNWNDVQVDAAGRIIKGRFKDYIEKSQVEALIAEALEAAAASAAPTESGLPSGIIVGWAGTIATIPSGWALCDGTNGTPNLLDRFILSVGAAENPGATGGSNTHSHTFTGTPGNTGDTSAGTPSGTVSAPVFTGTPDNTSSDSAGTPSGTNSGGSVGSAVTGISIDNHNYTPTGTNSSVNFVPSGTISWPAGVPTFAGSALGTHSHGIGTYAAANESSHTHAFGTIAVAAHPSHTHTYTEVPNHVHVQTTNNATTGSTGTGVGAAVDTSTSGGPSTCWFSTLTNTGGVATGTTAGPSATLTHTVSGSTAAGSAHTHSLSGSSEAVSAGTPAGTISWPAGVPTFAGDSGSVSGQTFTGNAAVLTHTVNDSGHVHTMVQPTFAGNVLAAHSHGFTPAGTNSAPTFTGSPLAVHNHTFTPAGTIDTASNVPLYFKLAWIQLL